MGVGGDDSQDSDDQRGWAAPVKVLPSNWRYEETVEVSNCWDPLSCSYLSVFFRRHTRALPKNSCSVLGAPGSDGQQFFIWGAIAADFSS